MDAQYGLSPEAAAIVEQLRETNRLLAIIAGVPYVREKSASTRPSKVEVISSNGLDGTVRRAEIWPDGSLHEIPQAE